jgi:RNA polymerase sigma-70 factor (ECF subfamily)
MKQRRKQIMAETKKAFFIPKPQLIAMVERLQRHEPEAETEIYIAFRDKIYGHLVKKTRDSEIADDLINDVFSEIFRTVHKLKEPAAFVSWCNLIVDHQIAAYFRKYRRKIALEEKLALEQQAYAAQAENEVVVLALLDKLPKKQARVLYLHIVEKYLIKEIAEIEGIPEGTVV